MKTSPRIQTLLSCGIALAATLGLATAQVADGNKAQPAAAEAVVKPLPADEDLEPKLIVEEGLPDGQWGFRYYAEYHLILKWDGQKQTLTINAQHFAPWWLDAVEDFRVDPKWHKGEVEKLHVAAFDRLSEEMQVCIYTLLNHAVVKPLLIPAE